MNPHAPLRGSIFEMFLSLWRNRQLIVQMTKREVIGRYRGSIMGLAWSFFNPLLLLAVYTFVFSVVFKARWGTGTSSKTEFALLLFAGMIVHGLFSECVNRAPALILANVNFVKKVVFPLEILPVVALGSALFHAAISLAVLLAFSFVLHLSLSWTIMLLPFVLLPLLLLTLGAAWFLSATGVYVRDIAQITGLFTTVLMFLSPVFYPASALPSKYQTLLHLNPLTTLIEGTRSVLIFGDLPSWTLLGGVYVASSLIAYFGFAWFQKIRGGFADVV